MRVIVYLKTRDSKHPYHSITVTNVTTIKHHRTDNIVYLLHDSEILAELYYPQINSLDIIPDKDGDSIISTDEYKPSSDPQAVDVTKPTSTELIDGRRYC